MLYIFLKPRVVMFYTVLTEEVNERENCKSSDFSQNPSRVRSKYCSRNSEDRFQ